MSLSEAPHLLDPSAPVPTRTRQPWVAPITRHRFSAGIVRELAALRRLDNWHGVVALVVDWAVIVGVAAVTELCSGWLWWLVYLLVALPVIATRQRALATLLHESVHGVLARNRRLNTLLGTYPSAYLVLQAAGAYRRSHLRDHHGAFGNPYVDPDLRAHIASGVYRPRSGRSFALRYLIAPLLGLRTPVLLKELITSRLLDSARGRAGAVGVVAYLSAIGLLFVALGAGRIFLAFWMVPLLLVFPLVNWYIELLEHFPMAGHERTDIRVTRPRAVGPVSRHFLGIHNEGYHLDHHLSTRIPYWNLPAAHRIRLADPQYRAAVAASAPAGRGLLWQFRDMVRRVDTAQTSGRLGPLAHRVPTVPDPVPVGGPARTEPPPPVGTATPRSAP